MQWAKGMRSGAWAETKTRKVTILVAFIYFLFISENQCRLGDLSNQIQHRLGKQHSYCAKMEIPSKFSNNSLFIPKTRKSKIKPTGNDYQRKES